MRYKNIFKKWKTGNVVKQKINIINAETDGDIYRDTYEHVAPLGEFLKEYIKHLSISRWRRRWDWKLVEKEMRETLNIVTLDFMGH